MNQEQLYMDVALSLDELTKSVLLVGCQSIIIIIREKLKKLSWKRKLINWKLVLGRKSSLYSLYQMNVIIQKVDFHTIREKQESELSLLQNQISSFQSTLERLDKDNRDLENEKASLLDQLSEEEGNLENCAEQLESQYSTKHTELSTIVENKRKAYQELQDELNKKSKL